MLNYDQPTKDDLKNTSDCVYFSNSKMRRFFRIASTFINFYECEEARKCDEIYCLSVYIYMHGEKKGCDNICLFFVRMSLFKSIYVDFG